MALANNRSLSRKQQNEFGNFFDKVFRDFFSPDFYQEGGNFLPKVELRETDTNYLVCAELPGIKENDIDITLRDNSLIIQGEKKEESRQEDKGYFRSEFSYGNFYRAIPLGSEVDPDKVEATFKDGILSVTLNKVEGQQDKSKKIEIKH